jgi:hypothetical protein
MCSNVREQVSIIGGTVVLRIAELVIAKLHCGSSDFINRHCNRLKLSARCVMRGELRQLRRVRDSILEARGYDDLPTGAKNATNSLL